MSGPAWRAWHLFHWLLLVVGLVGPPIALVTTDTLGLLEVLVVYGLTAGLFAFLLSREFRRTRPRV